MAAPRLRFFPRPPLPVALNGNGKSSHAPESKSIRFQYAAADFWPVGVDAIAHGSPDGQGWYAGAWLAFACMSFRAQKLAQPPLWITEEVDGEEEWLEGEHPLSGLLKRPNPDMRLRAFLERTSLLLDGTGRCVWVKVRDRGKRVAALRPFGNDDVLKVEAANGRVFGKFLIRTATGPEEFGAEDVIHLYNEDPADPYGCVAPLDVAAARLGIDRTLVESIRNGLRNAVVPGMVLTFPENLTQPQVDEYRAGISAAYQEARNHGKSFIAGGGLIATQGRLGFEGLQGGELSKETEAAVCACFQVPPVIIGAYVGLANSSDRHNLETSRALFYENAIEPQWTRIEEALTDDLLAEVDESPLRFVRFVKTGVKALQEDQNAKADIIQKAGRALTVNDARVMLGLAPLEDERGEELMAAAPPAFGNPFGEPAKALRSGPETKADDRPVRWMLFDQTARAMEFGWKLAIAQELDADREAVVRIIREGRKAMATPTGRKDDDPYAPAPASAEEVRDLIQRIAEHLDLNSAVRWREKVGPLTDATARRAVERMALEMGLSFDVVQPHLEAYVQREAAWLVTQVTDTTKQSIRDALGAGLLEGESIDQLAERIQGAGAFAPERAELIARTETTRVTNGGQRETLADYQRESGEKITKTWLSARDARVRGEHRALDGETRDIDAAFSNGLQAPGEPNCRCTLTYSLA